MPHCFFQTYVAITGVRTPIAFALLVAVAAGTAARHSAASQPHDKVKAKDGLTYIWIPKMSACPRVTGPRLTLERFTPVFVEGLDKLVGKAKIPPISDIFTEPLFGAGDRSDL